MIAALLWFCVDDTLAAHLNNPALGQIPIWVILIIGLAIECPRLLSGGSSE